MPIEPFVPAKPGDPILAEKWNEIQVKIRTQLEDLSANKFNAAGGTLLGSLTTVGPLKVPQLGVGLPPNENASALAEVRGALVVSGSSATGLQITNLWDGFPDSLPNRASLCIDTPRQTLMIVGTRTAALANPDMNWPGAGRRVSVWDRLEVNGHLLSSTVAVNGPPTLRPVQELHVNGRLYLENGVIQRGGAAITSVADLGLYSRVLSNWVRIVSNKGPIKFFTDPGPDGAGGTQDMSIEPGSNVVIGGLKLDSLHTGWSNVDRNRGEISADPNEKTLMLVGNISAALDDPNMKWPGLGRRVSVWDRLEVNGHLLSTSHVINGPPTLRPVQDLHVNGRLYLEHGVIQRGGPTIAATTELGLYSQYHAQNIRLVTHAGSVRIFSDTDGGGVNVGKIPDLEIKYPGDTRVRRNLVVGTYLGVGVDIPAELLHVKGIGNIGLRIQTGAGPNDLAAIRFFQGDTQPHFIATNQAGRLTITNVLNVQNNKVGIGTGTVEPAAPLEVLGDIQMTRPGNAGSLKINSQHSGWSNPERDRGEISIDANYKTLMLIGSVSAALDDPNMKWPNGGRRVSVWDRLEVNGHLLCSTQVINGAATQRPVQELHLNGRMYIEQGIIQRGGAAVTTTSDLGLYSQYSGHWMRFVTNAGPIRFYADGGAGTNHRMSIETNGDVYMTGRLYPANGVNGVISDLAVKTDITPLPGALARLLQIRGVHFHWKDPSRGESPQVGVIAQEVEAVYPELVELDRDGFRRVQYAYLVAPLIEAVREQQQQLSDLRAELQALRFQIKA
jgi:hypothetical protein